MALSFFPILTLNRYYSVLGFRKMVNVIGEFDKARPLARVNSDTLDIDCVITAKIKLGIEQNV